MTPLDLMTDAKLFAARFAASTFAAWRVLLAVAFGLAHTLDEAARAFATQCTGRTRFPTRPVRELWVIVGRRGGKSLIAAVIAVYLACFKRYELVPGELAEVMVLAADRRQARVVFRYVRALFTLPMLASLITRETKESLTLSNGITIEIHTASFRATRGYTIVGAICDEMAFWQNEDAADPDTEILHAIRPAMATVLDSLLVVISSPYARRGELWRTYKEHYGEQSGADPEILVWKAATWVMNPSIPRDGRVIARAYADDEAVADAEYGGNFRKDVEAFISRDVLDALVSPQRFELPPLSDVSYFAFVDPSGGSADSMTLAIAHHDARSTRVVLDVLREQRPPFSPEATVLDFAEVLRRYRIDEVTGDRYAGEWPREQFRKAGITYALADKAKSELYRDLLPLLNSGRVELLDHPRLLSQLANLERRTARGGRDSIDHSPGAHDDVANAAAGALLLASIERPALEMW